MLVLLVADADTVRLHLLQTNLLQRGLPTRILSRIRHMNALMTLSFQELPYDVRCTPEAGLGWYDK